MGNGIDLLRKIGILTLGNLNDRPFRCFFVVFGGVAKHALITEKVTTGAECTNQQKHEAGTKHC